MNTIGADRSLPINFTLMGSDPYRVRELLKGIHSPSPFFFQTALAFSVEVNKAKGANGTTTLSCGLSASITVWISRALCNLVRRIRSSRGFKCIHEGLAKVLGSFIRLWKNVGHTRSLASFFGIGGPNTPLLPALLHFAPSTPSLKYISTIAHGDSPKASTGCQPSVVVSDESPSPSSISSASTNTLPVQDIHHTVSTLSPPAFIISESPLAPRNSLPSVTISPDLSVAPLSSQFSIAPKSIVIQVDIEVVSDALISDSEYSDDTDDEDEFDEAAYEAQLEAQELKRTVLKYEKKTFTAERVLGQGGFGTVVRAKDELGEQYAIKILHKAKLCFEDGEVSAKRVRTYLDYVGREYLAMRRVTLFPCSPFVAQLLYGFEDQDNVYFVMRAYPMNLATLLFMGRPFHPRHIKLLAAELVLALEDLRNNHIVHHDLKPDNILIGPDGHIAITDFGLCAIYSHDADRRECYERHIVVGTPGYVSPEICFPPFASSFSSDIWSFGAILLNLIQGTYEPFFVQYVDGERVQMSQNDTSYNLNSVPMDDDWLRNLLDCVLVEDQRARFTIPDIKGHPYFADIDWNMVRRREYPMTGFGFDYQHAYSEGPGKFTFSSWHVDQWDYHDKFTELQTAAEPLDLSFQGLIDFTLHPAYVRNFIGQVEAYGEQGRFNYAIWQPQCIELVCASCKRTSCPGAGEYGPCMRTSG